MDKVLHCHLEKAVDIKRICYLISLKVCIRNLHFSKHEIIKKKFMQDRKWHHTFILQAVSDTKYDEFDINANRKAKPLEHSPQLIYVSFASSNTRWLYVLIYQGKRWKWLELYHEVVILHCIKQHKGAFVIEFPQQFSHYRLCFNLISIYFTPLYGFYWGCACFIGSI